MAFLFRSLVIAYALFVGAAAKLPAPPLPAPSALVLVQDGALGHLTLEAELARLAANRRG